MINNSIHKKVFQNVVLQIFHPAISSEMVCLNIFGGGVLTYGKSTHGS
jgi:hypothetical protein